MNSLKRLMAMKYLEKKGIRKPFQTKKRINLSINELIEILNDYEKFRKDFDEADLEGY